MRWLWRFWLWVKFHLFQKHRFNNLVVEIVEGKPFVILPSVFNPGLFLTSDFMVASFNRDLIPAGSKFLDMGTGSGIGAIFASDWSANVTALDINPAAVRCATINTLLNQAENKVTVLESDLFSAVPNQQFDVILFNPPYYRGQPSSTLDRAFHATNVVEQFAQHLPQHLTPQGHALVLLSSTGDEKAFLQLFRQLNFQISIAAQKHLPIEIVTIYQLRIN